MWGGGQWGNQAGLQCLSAPPPCWQWSHLRACRPGLGDAAAWTGGAKTLPGALVGRGVEKEQSSETKIRLSCALGYSTQPAARPGGPSSADRPTQSTALPG